MIKKINSRIVTGLFALFIFVSFPINTSAKTLGDLKSEYNKLEEKYKQNQSQKKNNEAEASAASKRIDSIYGELAQA